MKLAIINQVASVGAWSYLHKLVEGIKNISSENEITIFTENEECRTFDIDELKYIGIEFEKLNETQKTVKKNKHNFLSKIFNKDDKTLIKNTNNRFDKFDLIFFSWPGTIDTKILKISRLETNKPIFFIPHDFIFTHSFGFDGLGYYTKESMNYVLENLKAFVNIDAIPIVSSHYIGNEFNRVFPNAKNKPNVVYLSYLNTSNKISDKQIEEFRKNNSLKDDYVLFASNNMPHKNLGNVLGAWYYVKQKYPNLKLIISGYGNINILGTVNTPYYMDHSNDLNNWDVKSLGLLNNENFITLMKGSKMVINASLCEAGNGSGVDAWKIGVPVVMSDIEPFKQQIENLGVKAEVFDPRNSKDIARAVIKIIDDENYASEIVKVSKEAIEKYSWNEVANQYLTIFKNNLKDKNDKNI